MTSRGKLAFMPFALHAAGGQFNLTRREKSGIKIKTPFAAHFIGYYAVKLKFNRESVATELAVLN